MISESGRLCPALVWGTAGGPSLGHAPDVCRPNNATRDLLPTDKWGHDPVGHRVAWRGPTRLATSVGPSPECVVRG